MSLQSIFAEIPPLADYRPEDFTIEPLESFTNRTYRLKNEVADWVLRVPRQDTSAMIDRGSEAYNLQRAIDLGLCPPILWLDLSGLCLMPTVKASRNLATADQKDKALLDRLVRNLARLHASEVDFKGRIDYPQSLKSCFSLMLTADRARLETRVNQALRLGVLAESRSLAPVPSHVDLVCDNILVQGSETIWFIDWEYSAMASPYWDLASLCNTLRLDAVQGVELLAAYGDRFKVLDPQWLGAYRFMLQVLSVCWFHAFAGGCPAAEERFLMHFRLPAGGGHHDLTIELDSAVREQPLSG